MLPRLMQRGGSVCLQVDVEAVAMRGPRACRDYWLMKHWLRNALLIVTWRARTKHVREAQGCAPPPPPPPCELDCIRLVGANR